MSTAISIPNGRGDASSSSPRCHHHSHNSGNSIDDGLGDDDECCMVNGSLDATVHFWDCIRECVETYDQKEHEKEQQLINAGFNEDDVKGISPKVRRRRTGAYNRSGLYIDTGKAGEVSRRNYFIPTEHTSPGKRRWLKAIQLARSQEDPWSKFNLVNIETEEVIRHRYNALKKRWVQDTNHVKMEPEIFNSGAMRDCYRLKKLSSFSSNQDWSRAANYVAKRYKSEVERDVYFQDVQLQMDAKLWGEEFDRHKPPKKVDIFQMCIIEFVNRPGKPLYHLEHFIEGNYIKYNSNSGFVDDTARCTPQAFSHFTFERSGHALIVVDIQGVDDLYTDPQIHTIDGSGYGDGNLGPRGMALFFHSHVCNDICKHLCLTQFDLAQSELDGQRSRTNSLSEQRRGTVVRDSIEPCHSPLDLTGLPVWSPGADSGFGAIAEDDEEEDEDDDTGCNSCGSSGGAKMLYANGFMNRRRRTFSSMSDGDSTSKVDEPSHVHPHAVPDADDVICEEEEEATRAAFHAALAHKHRPSCVHGNLQLTSSSNGTSSSRRRQRSDSASSEGSNNSDNILGRQRSNSGSSGSALGLIHLEMARCHEIGRFYADAESPPPVDWPAAIFHAEMAAKLGVVEGALNLAKLYLDMERNMFENFSVEEDQIKGLELMEQAAVLGDRSAMIHMARHYETFATPNWAKAAEFYQKALEREGESDAAGGYDPLSDLPMFKLQAKLADLLIRGGPNLEANPERAAELYETAAETATCKGQGKLAEKYYILSGEAYELLE